MLFGEGKPKTTVTQKNCRSIDIGYNVEESLPSLMKYAALTNNVSRMNKYEKSMLNHLEFMLPDGAWDNSWGSRHITEAVHQMAVRQGFV